MIVTQGGRFGGYGFYIHQGKPVFLYNFLDLKRTKWEGPPLSFNNASGIGRGGTGVLKVDGKEVDKKTMEHSIPLSMPWDENFDIGDDTGTAISDDYKIPFPFTGTLAKLTLDIDRPKLSPEDKKRLQEGEKNVHASQ
jgi:arylsulfatase